MVGPARVKPVGNLFEQEDGQTHSVGSNSSSGLRTFWFPAHGKTPPAKVKAAAALNVLFVLANYFRYAES